MKMSTRCATLSWIWICFNSLQGVCLLKHSFMWTNSLHISGSHEIYWDFFPSDLFLNASHDLISGEFSGPVWAQNNKKEQDFLQNTTWKETLVAQLFCACFDYTLDQCLVTNIYSSKHNFRIENIGKNEELIFFIHKSTNSFI